MTQLIGFCGKLGAGKDTAWLAVEQWAKENGRTAVRRGFADKLKWSAARIFYPKITLEDALEWANTIKQDQGDYNRTEIREYHTWAPDIVASVTGRQFLQRYGTEAHRQVFDDNFWVNALLPDNPDAYVPPTWPDNFDNADFAVITDVRFPNEAERIYELRGDIIEIVRPSLETQEGPVHASEAGFDRHFITRSLSNDGTIEELHEKVKDYLTEVYE